MSKPLFTTLASLALLSNATITPVAAQGTEKPSIIMHRRVPKELKVAKWGPESIPSPLLAFKAAKLMPGNGNPIHDAVIVTQNSKILAVGKASEVAIPEGCQVIDMGDNWLVPGLVDLHCHIMGSTGRDFNDMVHPTNPELRTMDMVAMDLPAIEKARAGGITTVLFIPGSGSNMGGFGTLCKTAGTFEEALVRFPGSLSHGHEPRSSDDLEGRLGLLPRLGRLRCR
jgi:hypothetical protein